MRVVLDENELRQGPKMQRFLKSGQGRYQNVRQRRGLEYCRGMARQARGGTP